MNSYTSSTTKFLYYSTQILWFLLGILEALLVFRFILKLLAANPSAGFTHFIYVTSNPFIEPFVNVFTMTTVEGSIFEWTTLLAMLVYGLVGYGISKLLLMSRPVSTPEAAEKLDKEN
ncbi:MAG: YggT family protein [Candidatus Moranbacteria bacterium]|nr:YggT family protein [Candidatus Moranbacteria bacterium]